MFSRKLAVFVLVLLATSVQAALVRQEKVIAGSTQDSLEVRHLVLSGTNEEIGRALAEIARDRYEVRLEPSADRLRTRAKRRYIERNYPILYDRLRGVAAAYDLRLEDDAVDATQLNIADLRAGCSIVHLPAAMTSDGKSVVSRDYDFSTGGIDFKALPPGMLHPTSRPYLVELHPDRGYASIAMVAYDLLSGVLDGMNSEGLTVTMAMDDETFSAKQVEPTYGTAPGLGVLETMRMLLDTCATVEEAKEALLVTKQYYEFVPVHFLVADRHGKAFVWEYSQFHNKEFIIENPNGPLVATNFTLSTRLDEQGGPPSPEQTGKVCRRYTFLTQQLNGKAQISEEMLRTTHRKVDAQAPAAADPSRPPVRTFWHALYYPEERRVKFSFYLRDEPVPGQPDKVHIARTDYLEFRLGPTTATAAAPAPAEPTPKPAATAPVADDTVTALRNAGATLDIERDRVVAVGLTKTKDAAALLPLLQKLPALRILSLAGTSISDADLAQLTALRRLEILSLNGTGIGDAGLAHIGKLTGITGLMLANTKVTDAGLVHLKPLGRLTKLNVKDTAVTEEGAAKAKEFLPFWAKILR